MSEARLWQLRAGLITEDQYQEGLGNLDKSTMVKGTTMNVNKQQSNVANIEKALQTRSADLTAINNASKLQALLGTIIKKIQANNHDSLDDMKVKTALKALLASYSHGVEEPKQ